MESHWTWLGWHSWLNHGTSWSMSREGWNGPLFPQLSHTPNSLLPCFPHWKIHLFPVSAIQTWKLLYHVSLPFSYNHQGDHLESCCKSWHHVGVKSLPVMPTSPMGTGLHPGCSFSNLAPLVIFLGKQWKIMHVLGPLHPCGIAGYNFRLLALTYLSSAWCGHLRREPFIRWEKSITLFVSVTLPFK